MSAYLQMGHDSINLIVEGGLEDFGGVVLSPVNANPAEIGQYIAKCRKSGDIDVVLDPQLYYPANERGKLSEHDYFPSDFETADRGSDLFWQPIIAKLAAEGRALGVDSVCSPIYVPKKYDGRYFERCTRNFELLRSELGPKGAILTVCMAVNEFGDPNDAFNLSSRLTRIEPRRCYLVLVSDSKPRREIADHEVLVGLMAFIASMESAGCEMVISHCSSDIVLFKAAGASHCASGKYFNLRRFTAGRFREDGDAGGKSVTYWFEEGLLAFLRQPDVLRIENLRVAGILNQGDSNNPFGRKMWEDLHSMPSERLLGLSWRQYLSWFARIESRLSSGPPVREAKKILLKAAGNWVTLENRNIHMDESDNSGTWVRSWKEALDEFSSLEI